jgi:hypothetical protein
MTRKRITKLAQALELETRGVITGKVAKTYLKFMPEEMLAPKPALLEAAE